MKPKTIDEVIKIYSESTGYNENLIKDVTLFYWKEGIRKNLVEMSHYSINVDGLGTFNLIRNKIPRIVEALQERFEKDPANILYKDNVKYAEKLINLQEKIKGDYDRQNNIRARKEQFYKDLEEQEKDT